MGPIARCAVEIARGYRSPTAISQHVLPDIIEGLKMRAALARRLRGNDHPGRTAAITVSGIRTCMITANVVEASAVIHEVGRSRFVAMRFEKRRGHWRVVVLELG
ncbi:Rv3235 family protein [Devriesea agamarum]|uniref:Rv3235 family protein n=1 Tax=Devriesea agamarum TaxID=472569 RepID=UPI0012EE6B0A